VSLSGEAFDLVTCQHGADDRVKVVVGVHALWCKACGAIFDGQQWERPHRLAKLKKAIPPIRPIRSSHGSRTIHAHHAHPAPKKAARKSAKKGARKGKGKKR